MTIPGAILDSPPVSAGTFAPVDASYLVLGLNAILTDERVFTPGTGLAAVDGGPGGLYTLNATPGAGPWDTTGTVVHLDISTNNVTIGSAANIAKLGIVGDTDEVQFRVRGDAGQTADLVLVEDSASVERFSIDPLGNTVVTQGAATTGSPTAFTVTGGAHTTLAATIEAVDIDFDLARTVEFATGALALQRAVVIQAPTYAFVAASTLTLAIGLDVAAPLAGAFATITTSLAGRFVGGSLRVDLNGASTTFFDIDIGNSLINHITGGRSASLEFGSGANVTNFTFDGSPGGANRTTVHLGSVTSGATLMLQRSGIDRAKFETGSSDQVTFGTIGADFIDFITTNTARYRITAVGNLEMRTDLDFIPLTDSTGEIGTDANRFLRVRAVSVVQGDIGFDDKLCPKCKQTFDIGNELTIVIRRKEKGISYGVPAHRECRVAA